MSEDIFSVNIDVSQGERLGILLAGGNGTPIQIKSYVVQFFETLYII